MGPPFFRAEPFEKLSLRVGKIYSHFPKICISNRQTIYLLAGAIFLGASAICYYYLKPVWAKVKLVWQIYQLEKKMSAGPTPLIASQKIVQWVLENQDSLKETSSYVGSLNPGDQQKAYQLAEAKIIEALEKGDYAPLFARYTNTYVRGGRYAHKPFQSRFVQLYIQRWRTQVLQKVLLEHFKSQINIPYPSTPAENELLLLAQKS